MPPGSKQLTPLAIRLARQMHRRTLHPTYRQWTEFLMTLGGPRGGGDPAKVPEAIEGMEQWFPKLEFENMARKQVQPALIHHLRQRLDRQGKSSPLDVPRR